MQGAAGGVIRFIAAIATAAVAIRCSPQPPETSASRTPTFKSEICWDLILHTGPADEDSATCRLLEGISPLRLLPDSVFGTREQSLHDTLNSFAFPTRTYDRDDAKWFVLAQSERHLEAACFQAHDSSGAPPPDLCFWRLESKNLPPDVRFDRGLADTIAAIVDAGLHDGFFYVEASRQAGKRRPVDQSLEKPDPSEYIILKIRGRAVKEISWHDSVGTKGMSPKFAAP